MSENLFDAAERLTLDKLEGNIDSPDRFQDFGQYVQRVKEVLTALDEQRQTEIAPHRAMIDSVNKGYAKVMKPLEHTEELLKQALVKWAVDVQTKGQQVPFFGAHHLRQIWKYEIIDADALPHEYMTPDHSKLGKLARAAGDTVKVKGVKFYPVYTYVAKGGDIDDGTDEEK